MCSLKQIYGSVHQLQRSGVTRFLLGKSLKEAGKKKKKKKFRKNTSWEVKPMRASPHFKIHSWQNPHKDTRIATQRKRKSNWPAFLRLLRGTLLISFNVEQLRAQEHGERATICKFFFFSFFFQLSLPRSESREGGTRAHAEGKHDPSCRNAERDGCGGPCPTQNFPKTSQSRRLQSRRRNSTQKQNSAVAGTPRCGTCSSLTQKGGKSTQSCHRRRHNLFPCRVMRDGPDRDGKSDRHV